MTSIEIAPWNPDWSRDFCSIKHRLLEILGDVPAAIEHVGSTAVEGLAAKPIIDVDILVADMSLLNKVIEKLSCAGFVHRGNLGISGREAFFLPPGFPFSAHIYAGVAHSPAFVNHLTVRNALRSSAVLREQYGKIKYEIAHAVGDDRAEYTRRKSIFLCELLKKYSGLPASELLSIEVANRHDVCVRDIVPGDEEEVAKVHIQSWREAYEGIVADSFLDGLSGQLSERVAWWKGHICAMCAAHEHLTRVAVCENEIVGFVSVGASRSETFAHMGEVWGLYLLRSFHRKQIGYLLLCEGMKALRARGHRSAFAWVLAGNPAEAFYLRTGAQNVNRTKTVSLGESAYEERVFLWNSLESFC